MIRSVHRQRRAVSRCASSWLSRISRTRSRLNILSTCDHVDSSWFAVTVVGEALLSEYDNMLDVGHGCSDAICCLLHWVSHTCRTQKSWSAALQRRGTTVVGGERSRTAGRLLRIPGPSDYLGSAVIICATIADRLEVPFRASVLLGLFHGDLELATCNVSGS
jgi:hypothetical protein